MEAILEIYSETGAIQASGDGGIGFGLSATGNVTLVNDGATHPQPMVIASVTVQGANPIFSYKANGRICIERVSVSGGNFTFYLRAQSNVPIGLQYWIFDTSAGAIKDPTMADVEAALYDQYGVKTIDFTNSFMRIAGSNTVPKHDGTVPFGRGVNLGNTQTFTVPSGKVYAIAQASPAYIFTTHDVGGYSNAQNRPEMAIIDDGGDPGIFRWRQQELQSYQATGGYIGGNVIEVGMTRFEYFNLGWQPANSTPIISVYGVPRHIILDVTNFVAAGAIDPTTVIGNVNATTRSVTNGGAETITQSITPAVTVTASGGNAPHYFEWQFVSGSDQVWPNGSSYASTFSTVTNNQPAGTVRSAIYRCRIEDSNGYVGFSPDVTFSHTAAAHQNDYIPNPLSLVPLTFVSNDNHAGTSDWTELQGFNQPITLRVQSYFVSGTMDAQAVYIYRGPGGTWGPWEHVGTLDPRSGTPYADIVYQPNQRLHYVIDSVTYSGRKTNAFDLVVWNMSNPGGPAQLSNKRMTLTVDNDNNYNLADYTPNPISVPNLTGYVTNSDVLNTDGRFFQITGINATTYLRFTRDSLVQSGNVITRRLYIYKSTTGSGGPWTQYQLGATAGAYTDIPMNNGDWCYVAGYIDTSSGIASASWRNYIDYHDTQTVLGRLATFDISGTVDADNNFNNIDVTPDAFNYGDTSLYTNDPSGNTSTPVVTISGINQDILLRVERYSPSGSMDAIQTYVYGYRPGVDAGWVLKGQFDPRSGGLQYVDFWVRNGDQIHYRTDAVTTYGRKDFSQQMVIWNLSAPGGSTQLSNNTQTITVDANNDYIPAVDYSPNPISFANISGGSFNQDTQVSRSTATYQLTGFSGAITTRLYLGYWQHYFYQQSGGGGPIQVGDGPQSGNLNLDIYRNGAFVGSLAHYMYGTYSGAEQYVWRDDITFNPNDTVMFVLTLTGDLSEFNAALDASTQGAIYFDNLTVPGERIGSFTHTMSISKPSSGPGGIFS